MIAETKGSSMVGVFEISQLIIHRWNAAISACPLLLTPPSPVPSIRSHLPPFLSEASRRWRRFFSLVAVA